MKRIFILMLAIAGSVQFANAQAPAETWKDRVVGHWRYLGTEEFGVVRPADSTQAKDVLDILGDGTFSRTESGKVTTGTYAVNETAKTITFKDAAGKSRMYYLKKSDPGVLTIEFQTPDLVRTRYKFETIKD